MNLTNCPNCNLQIEDDSIYCDQCGNELFSCVECNQYGKGKFCPKHGKPLIPAKNKINNAGISAQSVKKNPSTDSPNLTAVQPLQGVASRNIVNASPLPVPNKLNLINNTLGANISIESGDILGRNQDKFIQVLADMPQISGKHLKFEHSNLGWAVTDLNSTNGTIYKQGKLQPMIPQVIENNSYLQIANIEFYISMSPVPNYSSTMRL